ncbi:hypothetical protein YQE_01366, partial [Dendroctonus ponderosae]
MDTLLTPPQQQTNRPNVEKPKKIQAPPPIIVDNIINFNEFHAILTQLPGAQIKGSELKSLSKSRLVPQCKKCQAYGHTQKYCAMEPRCVRCTGKHLTMECKKPKNEKPKCVHCGKGHPANYRECMVPKEMQKLK